MVENDPIIPLLKYDLIISFLYDFISFFVLILLSLSDTMHSQRDLN